jgi:TatD DNase family protein
MHCFASDMAMAKKALELGLHLAFGGLITFSNLSDLRQVVKKVPMDRLLIETDAPYLTPSPYRGKRNEPLYVKHVAEKIAEIKGMSLEEVADITSQNAIKIYDLG